MAGYRRDCLLALFLYFLVGWELSEGNGFYHSVKNGRVNVNLKASSLWDNATVYLSTNLLDMASNKSHIFYVTVCQAYKLDKKSWRIEPTKNLFEFCNNVRRCGPVKVNNTLTSAWIDKRTGEMFCQLFTTCTNYEDTFSVHVTFTRGGNVVDTSKTQEMTIFSENILPDFKESDNKVKVEYWNNLNSPVVLKINYFEPSELCGFGKPSEKIYFQIRYRKLNDTNCFDLGLKNEFYQGSSTKVKFNEILKETEVLFAEVVARSRGTSKMTKHKEYRIETLKKDRKCDLTGGVVNISWRPQWKCFPGKNFVDVAYFCFNDGRCYPVCEASFFGNGTLRHTRTYNDVIQECKERSHVCKIFPEKDIEMHTVSWSPETQRISCVLFRTCMDYSSYFSVMAGLAYLENENRDVIYNTYVPVCVEGSSLIFKNQPAIPQDVTATSIQATQFNITWKSMKCEIDHYGVELRLNLSGTIKSMDEAKRFSDGLNYIYQYTEENVQPYQEFTYQVYAYDFHKDQSSRPSPLKRLWTKPSAPDAAPTLTGIESEHPGIRLTWTFPNAGSLNGLPNETRIIGRDENGTEVYRGSVYGVNRTSALLAVNAAQKCAFYQVKFCNAPHLCSEYSSSNGFRLHTCEKRPTLAGTVTEAESSLSNIQWIIVSIGITIIVVVVIVIILCYRKEKREMREKLPTLTTGNDQTGDYIPVGQLSYPGEYSTLDEKKSLDELLETSL